MRLSNTLKSVSLLSLLVLSSESLAWGKRGHQIVGETAALIVSSEKGGHFLKDHSFDFGYYNNVPDIVWKRPETYKAESNNHFMDMELFKVPLNKKKASLKKAFQMSRKEFASKYPEVPEKAGRAFWRIREMEEALSKVTDKLKKSSKKDIKAHQKLQGEWLVLAGTLGHYVGDLAQPLHVTENYDGQLTDQKGIHHVFETTYVDELYPQLSVDVLKEARKRWPEFKKKNKNKSVLELIMMEAEESHKDLEPLLAMDKKQNRKEVSKNAKAFREMIIKRQTAGALTLAEIYRRHLGWDYVGDKFYFFGSEPKHFPVKSK